MSTKDGEREKFVAAAVLVLGWTEEYADKVFDQNQKSPAEIIQAIHEWATDFAARTAPTTRPEDEK